MSKVYVGTWVDVPTPDEPRIVADHVVELDEKGIICAISAKDSDEGKAIPQRAIELEEEIVYLPESQFFIPAFCDLHLHAPQFLYQGTGLDLLLMEWLDKYAYKAEEQIDSDDELARTVYTRLAKRLKENGTGTVLLFGTINVHTNLILAEVMQEAGIRAFVGKVSMDMSTRKTYNEESASKALVSAKLFIEGCESIASVLPEHERLVKPVITPRFVPTCSDELLEGLGDLSKSTGAMIHSHASESRDEVDWVNKERGMNDLTIFDNYGLLTSKTVQAHCTFLEDDQLRLLKKRGASIAHCPLSNAYFSSKPFRLREALDIGFKVGLGTDIAGGYSLDIMNAMRSAVMVSRMREGAKSEEGNGGKDLRIDWITSLYLATRGGAMALGLPVQSGTFVVGAPFDAQLIQLYDPILKEGIGALEFFNKPWEGLTVDVVEKWWCIGDVRNRKSLFVQGRQVLEN